MSTPKEIKNDAMELAFDKIERLSKQLTTEAAACSVMEVVEDEEASDKIANLLLSFSMLYWIAAKRDGKDPEKSRDAFYEAAIQIAYQNIGTSLKKEGE